MTGAEEEHKQDVGALKGVIHSCNSNIGDEGERAFEKARLFEDLRHENLNKVIDLLEQYSHLNAHQLTMVNTFKKEEDRKNR